MNMNTTNTTHPRERLIATASALVHRQGWTATGINQILSDAGIPKGSFYYYFRSKEALGVAVLQKHHTELKSLLDRTLGNPGLSADVAIYELLKEMASPSQDSFFSHGCPVGVLAAEIATQSESLLTEANRCLSLYETAWRELISRGQKEGSISPSIEPGDFSKVAALMLQGALHAVRRSQESSPLELVFSWLHQTLFAKPATSGLRIADGVRLQVLAS